MKSIFPRGCCCRQRPTTFKHVGASVLYFNAFSPSIFLSPIPGLHETCYSRLSARSSSSPQLSRRNTAFPLIILTAEIQNALNWIESLSTARSLFLEGHKLLNRESPGLVSLLALFKCSIFLPPIPVSPVLARDWLELGCTDGSA